MTPPLCTACGHEVARGALRCRSCGAAFEGRGRAERIDAKVSDLSDEAPINPATGEVTGGVGIRFTDDPEG